MLINLIGYSFIELPNGLRAMLISSLKPGETAESMEEAFVDGVEESDHGEDVICVDDVAPKNEIRKVCRIPSLYLI